MSWFWFYACWQASSRWQKHARFDGTHNAHKHIRTHGRSHAPSVAMCATALSTIMACLLSGCDPNAVPLHDPAVGLPPSDEECERYRRGSSPVPNLAALHGCFPEGSHCADIPVIDSQVACNNQELGQCHRRGLFLITCNENKWLHICHLIDPPHAPLQYDYCDGEDADCDGRNDEDEDETHEIAVRLAQTWETISPPLRDDDPATPDVDSPIRACGRSLARQSDPIWPNELVPFTAADVEAVYVQMRCRPEGFVAVRCSHEAVCDYTSAHTYLFGTVCREMCEINAPPIVTCDLE